MKRLTALLGLTTLACFTLAAGCSKAEAPARPEALAPTPDTGPSDASPPAAKKWTIGMSQCNLGEPWRVQMNADIAQAAATHPKIEVVFKDAQNDTLKQRSHIEEFASQPVDLLIVSPKEAAPLTPPIAAAYKAGIPVIVLDRAVLGEDYTVFIGADNKLIGEAAGRWLAAKLGGQGKIVELKGLMTSIPGQDRNSGFRKGLEGTQIEVLFEADMQWLEPNARKEMESALARFDHIDAVYGHNDPGAHGAWLAAKAAGREKEMLFVGIDALPHEGQAYVDQGILSATFLYPTGGVEAIDTALKLLAGETVSKKIVVPTKIFTPENVKTGGAPLNEPQDAARAVTGT
ncbi:MAG: substrate-binding domain-containing protein [Candidatus Hydrogenedentes bacterium]|nr:substrate-binding domain-containing protein [Candidatus Hydrogenedentota bacterium]